MASPLPPLRGSSSCKALEDKMDSVSFPDKVVVIDKVHYEQLLLISRKYENIKRSLLGGGVSRENFDVLANDAIALPPADVQSSESTENFYSPKYLGRRSSLSGFRADSNNGRKDYSSPASLSPEESISEVDSESDGTSAVTSTTDSDRKPVYKIDDDDEPRTIELRNLPDRVTHLDLTNAIRGGALLEVYLRYNDNSARVAFADARAARAFLERARRHDVYIGSKRLEVSWSDRPFFLRPYIRQNLQYGASRNLAIHNINPNITESLIREHLEHIHNLVVVDIKLDYQQAIAHISTNSVHNAMFARSCMKSRATYRGMRIDFEVDGCLQPYEDEQVQQRQNQYQNHCQQKPPVAVVNRKSKPDYYQQTHHHRPAPSLSNRFEMLRVGSGSESDSGSDTETEDA